MMARPSADTHSINPKSLIPRQSGSEGPGGTEMEKKTIAIIAVIAVAIVAIAAAAVTMGGGEKSKDYV